MSSKLGHIDTKTCSTSSWKSYKVAVGKFPDYGEELK